MTADGARGVDAAARARMVRVAQAWRVLGWGSLSAYADDVLSVLDALDAEKADADEAYANVCDLLAKTQRALEARDAAEAERARMRGIARALSDALSAIVDSARDGAPECGHCHAFVKVYGEDAAEARAALGDAAGKGKANG